MSQAVLEKILEGKIIAIVRGIPSTKIVGLAQALEKGGVNCIEVTFDQSRRRRIPWRPSGRSRTRWGTRSVWAPGP